MRCASGKQRLVGALRGECGFTLPEVLVVVAIMGFVLAALYGLFSASIRVFSYGNDSIESTENARVALERMEREIRAAYPYNQAVDTSQGKRVLDASQSNASQITFFNDLNGNGRICSVETPPCTSSPENAGERISFSISGGGDNRSLARSENGGTPQALTALGPGGALTFQYYHRTTGAEITNPAAADEPNIGKVRITLRVAEDGAWQDPRQDLATDVDLRNRSSS